MNTITTLIIISVFCNGLRIMTEPKMLLHSIYKKAEQKWPKWIFKPIIGCVYCYASFWGSIVYWLLMPFTSEALIMWPIACVCCVYLNGLLYGIYSKFENYIQ